MKFLRIKNHVYLPLSDKTAALTFGRSTFILPQDLTKQFVRIRDELAKGTALRKDIPKRLLRFLVQYDLIMHNSSIRGTYSADEAIEIISSAIEMWKPLPGFHPIFKQMHNNKQLQLSFLLEQTVFVKQAYSYFSLAARHTRSRSIGKFFSEFAVEEKHHYKGLAADLDLSETDLLIHDPAPGTQALVSFLHDLAVRDSNSLVIATAIFETSEDDIPVLRKFYGRLETSLGLKLKNFLGHHELDLKLEHSEIWRVVLARRRSVTYRELSAWINSLHMTKHVVEMWFDSIVTEARRSPIQNVINIKNLIRPKPEAGSIYVGAG